MLTALERQNIRSNFDHIRSFFNNNIHRIKNIQCIAVNIFLKYSFFSILLNVPLRIYNCVQAYQINDNWKIVIDIASIGALILIGPACSIVIDAASEGYAYYLETRFTLDPLAVFGLSEKEACDKKILDNRYHDLCQAWDKRMEGTRSSPYFFGRFKQKRANTDKAYKILLERLQTKMV